MNRINKSNINTKKKQQRKADCPFHHSILAYIEKNASIDKYKGYNRKTNEFLYGPILTQKALLKNFDPRFDRKSKFVKIGAGTRFASYSSSAYTLIDNHKSISQIRKSVSLINREKKSPYLKEQTIFLRNEPLDRNKYRVPSLSPPKRKGFYDNLNRSKSLDPQKQRSLSQKLSRTVQNIVNRIENERTPGNSRIKILSRIKMDLNKSLENLNNQLIQVQKSGLDNNSRSNENKKANDFKKDNKKIAKILNKISSSRLNISKEQQKMTNLERNCLSPISTTIKIKNTSTSKPFKKVEHTLKKKSDHEQRKPLPSKNDSNNHVNIKKNFNSLSDKRNLSHTQMIRYSTSHTKSRKFSKKKSLPRILSRTNSKKITINQPSEIRLFSDAFLTKKKSKSKEIGNLKATKPTLSSNFLEKHDKIGIDFKETNYIRSLPPKITYAETNKPRRNHAGTKDSFNRFDKFIGKNNRSYLTEQSLKQSESNSKSNFFERDIQKVPRGKKLSSLLVLSNPSNASVNCMKSRFKIEKNNETIDSKKTPLAIKTLKKPERKKDKNNIRYIEPSLINKIIKKPHKGTSDKGKKTIFFSSISRLPIFAKQNLSNDLETLNRKNQDAMKNQLYLPTILSKSFDFTNPSVTQNTIKKSPNTNSFLTKVNKKSESSKISSSRNTETDNENTLSIADDSSVFSIKTQCTSKESIDSFSLAENPIENADRLSQLGVTESFCLLQESKSNEDIEIIRENSNLSLVNLEEIPLESIRNVSSFSINNFTNDDNEIVESNEIVGINSVINSVIESSKPRECYYEISKNSNEQDKNLNVKSEIELSSKNSMESTSINEDNLENTCLNHQIPNYIVKKIERNLQNSNQNLEVIKKLKNCFNEMDNKTEKYTKESNKISQKIDTLKNKINSNKESRLKLNVSNEQVSECSIFSRGTESSPIAKSLEDKNSSKSKSFSDFYIPKGYLKDLSRPNFKNNQIIHNNLSAISSENVSNCESQVNFSLTSNDSDDNKEGRHSLSDISKSDEFKIERNNSESSIEPKFGSKQIKRTNGINLKHSITSKTYNDANINDFDDVKLTPYQRRSKSKTPHNSNNIIEKKSELDRSKQKNTITQSRNENSKTQAAHFIPKLIGNHLRSNKFQTLSKKRNEIIKREQSLSHSLKNFEAQDKNNNSSLSVPDSSVVICLIKENEIRHNSKSKKEGSKSEGVGSQEQIMLDTSAHKEINKKRENRLHKNCSVTDSLVNKIVAKGSNKTMRKPNKRISHQEIKSTSKISNNSFYQNLGIKKTNSFSSKLSGILKKPTYCDKQQNESFVDVDLPLDFKKFSKHKNSIEVLSNHIRSRNASLYNSQTLLSGNSIEILNKVNGIRKNSFRNIESIANNQISDNFNDNSSTDDEFLKKNLSAPLIKQGDTKQKRQYEQSLKKKCNHYLIIDIINKRNNYNHNETLSFETEMQRQFFFKFEFKNYKKRKRLLENNKDNFNSRLKSLIMLKLNVNVNKK